MILQIFYCAKNLPRGMFRGWNFGKWNFLYAKNQPRRNFVFKYFTDQYHALCISIFLMLIMNEAKLQLIVVQYHTNICDIIPYVLLSYNFLFVISKNISRTEQSSCGNLNMIFSYIP